MTKSLEAKSELVSAIEDAPSGRLSTASSQAPVTTAGRELDALVVRHVYGREVKWHGDQPSYVTPDNGDGWVSESTVPRFSTSLHDAYEVAITMKGGFRIVRHPFATKRPFTVTLYPERTNVGYTAEAATLPLAICFAALQSVGL